MIYTGTQNQTTTKRQNMHTKKQNNRTQQSGPCEKHRTHSLIG